jgi:aspartate/methionine/tyrosine aminotransferase
MTASLLRPSARAQAVSPFHVMRILDRAKTLERQGRDVIHMEVGEPDFPTPEPVIAAARRALEDQALGYTPAAGLPELRGAIAGWYGRRYGLDLDPRRVIVTPGGSGALQLVLAALLEPGDGVLVTDPGYPCNRHLVSIAGGRAIPLPVMADDDFQPTVEAVAARWHHQVRALMVATPANPTGSVLTPATLRALHDLVSARGGGLIVDEIYQGLVYEVEDHTALAGDSDALFVINSFSKFFGMTGWRLGWVVAPPGFVEVLERLAQNLFLAPPTLSQYAALGALDPGTLPLLETRRQEFRRRRDALLAALAPAGFEVPVTPVGAFYVYARLPRGLPTALDVAEVLLEDVGVAITPGLDFGTHATARMVRFAYTLPIERLREGVERIISARCSDIAVSARRTSTSC